MIRKIWLDDAVAVEFVLPADHPLAPVSVVGSFNQWQPHRHPMLRRPDGSIRTTVITRYGEVLYFRYLGADGSWFDDADAECDEHGGRVIV